MTFSSSELSKNIRLSAEPLAIMVMELKTVPTVYEGIISKPKHDQCWDCGWGHRSKKTRRYAKLLRAQPSNWGPAHQQLWHPLVTHLSSILGLSQGPHVWEQFRSLEHEAGDGLEPQATTFSPNGSPPQISSQMSSTWLLLKPHNGPNPTKTKFATFFQHSS